VASFLLNPAPPGTVGPGAAAYENVVIEVPDRCFAGAGITEHITRVAITIEVAYGTTPKQPSTSVV